jgi:DNA-binding transcriptional ArsR family regulator
LTKKLVGDKISNVAALALQLLRDPETARVLLEPKRRAILERLQAEPNSASGLARVLEMPRQKVNYHLRELERVGLVEAIETKRKGSVDERIVRAKAEQYLISPEALGQLGQSPEERRDRFSIAYLISAAGRIIRDLGILAPRAARARQRLSTLTVELEVRFANAEARSAFTEELVNHMAALAAKYHDEASPGGREFRFVLGAYPRITKPAEDDGAQAVELEK